MAHFHHFHSQIKQCCDPVLSNVLTKVRMGICDKVVDVLSNIVQPPDVDNIELNRTVDTHKECRDINEQCIKNIAGDVKECEALDTDHHGHPIREADRGRGTVKDFPAHLC